MFYAEVPPLLYITRKMVLTPCSMRWIHIPCSTSHDALFPFVGADPISFRYAFRDVDPFSLCIAPCSRGNGFLSSRCLSHAPWGPYFLPRMPLSSRTWFPPRISLFSRGPDSLIRKPLDVMFSFSRRSFTFKVLTPSSRHPHHSES